MPARIVVTPYKGGSRVALIGVSGKELLASQVFHEPRAKGATLRSLKGLLGEAVAVEDHTLATRRPAARTTAVETAQVDGAKASSLKKPPKAASTSRRSTLKGEAGSQRRATPRRAARRPRAAAAAS